MAALLFPFLVILGWSAPLASAAPACSASWTGGAGSWDDAANWSGGAVPGPGDVACIQAASGSPAPKVTASQNETVDRLVMSGATLTVRTGVVVDVRSLDLAATTIAGPGAVVADRPLTPQQAGVQSSVVDVTVRGAGRLASHDRALTISGAVGLAAGSTLDLADQPQAPAGRVAFGDGARVADLDGAAGNQVLVSGSYDVTGAATLNAVTIASRAFAVASGRLTVPRLNWLRSGGALAGSGGDCPDLRVGGSVADFPITTATLVVGRSIHAVADCFVVEVNGQSRVLTTTGDDALSGLRRVIGQLITTVGPTPLALTGRLRIDPSGSVDAGDLVAPSVEVLGTLSVSHLETRHLLVLSTGRVQVFHNSSDPRSSDAGVLTSSGILDLGQFTSATDVELFETSRTVVRGPSKVRLRGRAHVDGSLDVNLAVNEHDGLQVVVLTARGGFDGRFTQVTAGGSACCYTVTLDYQPTRIVATFHAR